MPIYNVRKCNYKKHVIMSLIRTFSRGENGILRTRKKVINHTHVGLLS